MKVAFLDRDGTIILDYEDSEWSEKTEPEFIEGSIRAMQKLNEMGYEIIIVTNQYVINEGYITEDDFLALHEKFLQEVERHGVRILDTFYCPHSDQDNCNCKKPKPGMIESALAKYPDINLTESSMTGDSIADRGIAKWFNLTFYGIGFDKGRMNYTKGIPVASLLEAAESIENN